MKLRHNRIMTDALREIRHTRSRFLSLLVLSALSVCFLAGLRATAPDMKNSADLYFDQQRLMDLRITSTLGLTEEDAAALERQEGVLAVERAYTVDAMVHLTDDDYIVKVLSFTESPGLNAPKLVEGRLPQTAGECLVEPLLLEETGLSLGDAIALDTGSGSYEDALALEKFTIVGTANSPLYIGVDRGTSSLGTGQVSAFVLLPLEAFTLETYTDFYLQVEGAQDLNSYSDAYTQWIDDFSDSLEPFADQRARMRGDEVIGEANEALADAEAELSDAQAEAEAELSDAWAQLEEGRADLDEGWAEYRDGVRELNDQVAQAEQEIADGQGELDEALSELNDGEQELTDARADLDEGWTEYYDGLRDYEDGLAEFEDGRRQYEEGLAEYYDGLDQYQEGLDDYEDGERQVEDGWDEYYAGLEQYNDGAEELEQGRETLREQEAAFQEGLTQFRENLGSLGLSQYAAMSNSQLLSAMTDSAQAAVIDGALNSTRTSLSQGIELLNGIDALRTQLGGNADTDLSLLQSQRDGLIASISDLQGDIAELQEALAALSPDSPTYEADRQQLQSAIDALSGQLSTAQGNLEQMEELIAARTTLAQLEEQRDAAGLTHATAASLQAQLDALSGVSTSVFLSGQRQIDQGWQEIYDGQAELEDARQPLADARGDVQEAGRAPGGDWAQLADEVKDETGVRLYLATVDFLDGATLPEYGAGLRDKRDLGKKDLLLLMAAGEDTFGFFGGESVNEKLSVSAQEKLLSTAFQAKFLAQDYDGALASLGPALARELGKCYGETISTAGLFGQAQEVEQLTAQQWLERQVAQATAAPRQESLRDRVTQEDEDSGISFGKVVLTVFLLMVIFGGDRRRRRGCGCSGCGCAPFSSLLAGLGLWKLWGDDHH